MGVLLVAMNSFQAVGFVAMLIPVAGIILLAVKRPYSRGYNNYRAIMNESVMLAVFAMYGYYRSAVKYHDQSIMLNALSYLELVLLFGCVATNIFFMGKLQYDKYKASKAANE